MTVVNGVPRGTERAATIFQVAAGFLTSNQGREFCAACLSQALGLKNHAGRSVMPKLEGHGRFNVRHGTCSSCERRRLVVATVAQKRADAPPDTAEPMPPDANGEELV